MLGFEKQTCCLLMGGGPGRAPRRAGGAITVTTGLLDGSDFELEHFPLMLIHNLRVARN